MMKAVLINDLLCFSLATLVAAARAAPRAEGARAMALEEMLNLHLRSCTSSQNDRFSSQKLLLKNSQNKAHKPGSSRMCLDPTKHAVSATTAICGCTDPTDVCGVAYGCSITPAPIVSCHIR